MKKSIVTLILLAFALAGFSAGAGAEDGIKIGYVDMRKVVNESKKGQRSRAALEKMVKSRQAELQKEQKKLKDLQASLEKEALTMSDAQKKQKQQEFQQKVQAYQAKAADAQKELGGKDAEFTKQAVMEIKAIIADIAKQENLALVLEKNQQPVLYAQDGPDLTDKVIKKYDAKK